jgi:hypothetical protein
LIARQGLIDASKINLVTDKTVAYRWGSAVWYQNRQESSNGDDDKPTLWDKRDGVTQRLFPGVHLSGARD